MQKYQKGIYIQNIMNKKRAKVRIKISETSINQRHSLRDKNGWALWYAKKPTQSPD